MISTERHVIRSSSRLAPHGRSRRSASSDGAVDGQADVGANPNTASVNRDLQRCVKRTGDMGEGQEEHHCLRGGHHPTRAHGSPVLS